MSVVLERHLTPFLPRCSVPRVNYWSMWKTALGIILASGLTHAQTFRDLLLPESQHLAGVVVDQEGNPVADARIDHSNDLPYAHQTDSEGRFALVTRAPIIVVRKAGFRSELVRTQAQAELRITLQKPNERRTFPVCSKIGKFEGIEGWGASFQFPRVSGVKTSQQVRDIDYGARSYYVHTKDGAKGISHGSGPNWSYGMPSDLDVWRSTTYEETTFDLGRSTIIMDARGQLPTGKRWRYLGKFGESASYSDVDEATAKMLDQVMDGACMKSASR
jgi:hypothetical protein